MKPPQFIILDTSKEIKRFRTVLEQLRLTEELFLEYDIVQYFFDENIGGAVSDIEQVNEGDFTRDLLVLYEPHLTNIQLIRLETALADLFGCILRQLIHARPFVCVEEMNYLYQGYCDYDLIIRKATREDLIN